MATRIAKYTLTYRDLRGHTGKCGTYIKWDDTVTGGGDAAAAIGENLQNATTPLTNAVLVNVTGPGGEVLTPFNYGAAAQYANAEDKMRLRLAAADGTIHSFEVPAPKLANFEADQQTVKASAVSALVAVFTAAPATGASFCTRAGSAYAGSPGGQLVRKAFQRKINIYDKSSNLDEPEE